MKARPQRAQKEKPKAQQKDPKGSGRQLQARDAWQRDMFAMAKGGNLAGEKATTGKNASKNKPKTESPSSKEKDPKKPTVTHETMLKARQGGKKRTKVGVGEEVKFVSNMEGRWEATNGSPTMKAQGDQFWWTAPNRADTVTIRFTAAEETISFNFKVVEPEHVVTSLVDKIAYPKGMAAAGMHLNFDYQPFDVSFGNVEGGEKSGPATKIKGYFDENYTPAKLWHDSKDKFHFVLENNRVDRIDEAYDSGEPPRWKKGEFHWVIPNRFRVFGETGEGKVFTEVTQSFYLKADGTMTIVKGESRVIRGINEG